MINITEHCFNLIKYELVILKDNYSVVNAENQEMGLRF